MKVHFECDRPADFRWAKEAIQRGTKPAATVNADGTVTILRLGKFVEILGVVGGRFFSTNNTQPKREP